MNKKRSYGISGYCYWTTTLATNRECLACSHYTGARKFIKSKRYIRKLIEGKCALGNTQNNCQKFEIMPELKAANMTILEKVYARKFSKSFLQKVVRVHFRDPNAEFSYDNFGAEKLANIIVWYLKNGNRDNRQ